MRLSILCLTCLTLSACTGVKSVDETWDCVTGNVPDGKYCAPIPTAEKQSDDGWGTYSQSNSSHSGIKKNAATIQKIPEKRKPPEYPLETKTPTKTWGN